MDVIITIRRLYPSQFEWKASHFDRLIGDDTTRSLVDQGASLDVIRARWDDFCNAFIAQRQPYLLYDRPDNVLRVY